MEQAWQLARKAARYWGGRASNFFAASLKRAWEVAKSLQNKARFDLEMNGWVALITGRNAQYTFDRKFLTTRYDNGTHFVHILDEGIYECKEHGQKRFFRVSKGSLFNITEQEVIATF